MKTSSLIAQLQKNFEINFYIYNRTYIEIYMRKREKKERNCVKNRVSLKWKEIGDM